MVRDGSTQQVELVDGPVDPGDPITGLAARVRRWWLLAGAAVLVLVLAGVQWVVDARADAATARLAAVPGVLAPLGDQLEVVRSLGEEETRSLLTSIPLTDQTWASIRVGEDGSQAFTATSLSSGEAVWSTPLLGPNPARAAGRQKSTGGECQAGADSSGAAATWAVCTVTDGYSTFSVAEGKKPVQATTTRVAVLDTGDGHLVAEWPVEHDAVIGVLPGQVLVGLRRDGDVEIVAHDARTGAERWRHRDSPAPNTSVPAGSWSFATAGDVAAYLDGDRLTVLSADGEVVRTDLESPRGENLVAAPGTGLPALPLRTQTGDLTGTTTLLARDADPARDRELRGRLLDLTVDDGSVPGLVLTSQDKLYAWDEESGRPRWERDLTGAGFDALVVRGRVFLCSSTSVVALDGRTGKQVWEAESPACSYSGLLTDGRDLLVGSIDTVATGPGGLTGYDFATGEVTRRMGFPAGLVALGPFQEHLLGYSRTFEEVALLR